MAGSVFTVTTLVVWQPLSAYVIIDVPNPATPVTIPVALPTVAFAGVPLVQAPPAGVLFSVVVVPMQTVGVPVIPVGVWFTVICKVDVQPVDGSVNVILDVPAETPASVVVVPGVVTVAMPGVPLVHVPLPGPHDNGVLAPVHTWLSPPMGLGDALTVTTAVVTALQEPPVTV